jgi:hypothetical protein
MTYWVIEDADGIYDYVNTEVRKEWEGDARFERRDPKDDSWLQNLSRRKWSLEIVEIARIKLNPEIMNYVDPERGHVFTRSLEKRSKELQESIKMGGLVIWPLIARKEDMQLADGYCRYTTLRAMNVSKTYAYVGVM